MFSTADGETEDTTIADLSVVVAQVKSRPVLRQSERVAKYNQLLWIEDKLGDSALGEKSEAKSVFFETTAAILRQSI